MDIEIPKGKTTEEMNVIAEEIAKDLQKAGIGFRVLTEKDKENIKEIIREKGEKLIEEQ